MPTLAKPQWDIFCKIVDNFGDIGVCWRLSQQLANEHHIAVRLFIDDFNIASKIIPTLAIKQAIQSINHVEIQAWPTGKTLLPNVVIESFSCQLPEVYMQQIAIHNHKENQLQKVSWINVEYLSAETWVENCHGLPSIHPTLGLKRHFFYPGFTEKTGGLLREQNLIAQRDLLTQSATLTANFWKSLIQNLSKVEPDASFNASIKISLFSYQSADIKSLINDFILSGQAISLFLPFNSEISALNTLINDYALDLNQVKSIHQLKLYLLPFLSQGEYDQLLCSCDLNFVRGEDSWVRAIWSGKPFIWQPYLQTENTHISKLNAFLAQYIDKNCPLATLIFDAHLIWSNAKKAKLIFWQDLIKQLPHWQRFSLDRSNQMALQNDLCSQIVTFSKQFN